MNRRHFVQTTGFSLGALMIKPGFSDLWHSDVDGMTVGPPDEVTAVSEKGTFTLRSSGASEWIANDIRLKLPREKRSVAIDVESPSENLKFIKLKWKAVRNAATRCLGDQWERSYGDLRWGSIDRQRIMPWYFMEFDGKVTNGFGVKTGCASMCFWQVGVDQLELTVDVRSGGNGVRLGDRKLRAAEIVVHRGTEENSPFVSTQKFCREMCESPRLAGEPVYGINDWYFAYGNNSDELILQHASLMAPFAAGNPNRPFCVIDAGWAVEAPGKSRNGWSDDFSIPNSHFKDMARLAEKIKQLGMRPGIWVRPLCGSIRDNPGILMPKIPRMDLLNAPFLDPTIPENLERIKHYFTLYRQWGYQLIKHDYTTADLLGKWGFKMIESGDMTFDNWSFHDNKSTNAEIILNLYNAIRESSGDACVIGCNTLSHLSAGLFELQRIGDDTSGQDWNRTRTMGVNALGFRIPQHDAFYATDGDCVGLTTKVPWEKNKQWMQLLAQSGTPLFISAQKEAVGAQQAAMIRESFATASRCVPTGEPLDWLENQCPAKWRLLGKTVEFDWS